MSQDITLLNTVWENASTDYQTRVPQATQDNITAVGNAILNYEITKNEFLNALVNKISLQIISSKMATNRLARFKKGMLPYGSSIEEIYTDMAVDLGFNVATAEAEVFKRQMPNVKSMYHSVNREGMYKVTIQDGQLKRAFTSAGGLGKLVSSIINSLYSGNAHDEYILMKQTIADYFTNVTTAKHIEVPKVVDQASAQTFMKAVKQTATDFEFMSTDFNPAGVMQKAEKSEQVLLIHKNVDTNVSTDLLAWAFNSNNFDPNVQKVVVDDFGTLGGVQAVLCDQQFFQVYDTLYQTTSQPNAQGLYTNYFLHHHQLLSASQFFNAVMFKIPPTV